MNAEAHAHNPPKESLGVLIGLVRAEIVRALEAELTAHGVHLRFTQYLIIKRLSMLGPMGAGELARAVDLDCGAMTRQLDQLEGKGYLRRCPHPQDRRTLRIELTAVGGTLWQQMAECQQRVLKTAQRELNTAERTQLHDSLGRVLHALRDKS